MQSTKVGRDTMSQQRDEDFFVHVFFGRARRPGRYHVTIRSLRCVNGISLNPVRRPFRELYRLVGPLSPRKCDRYIHPHAHADQLYSANQQDRQDRGGESLDVRRSHTEDGNIKDPEDEDEHKGSE